MRICCQSKPVILLLLLAFIITLSGCSKKEPEQKPQAGDTQNENKEPESFAQIIPGDRYLNHDYRPKVNFVGDASLRVNNRAGNPRPVRSKLSSRPNRGNKPARRASGTSRAASKTRNSSSRAASKASNSRVSRANNSRVKRIHARQRCRQTARYR